MKRILTLIMISAVTLMFVTTSVYAGDAYMKMGKMSSLTSKATDLIGTSVQNNQGEDLGKISDLAIDPQNGRVSFAVIASGGIMGIGDKLIPVPITALTFSEDMAILNVSKEKLASAPTFDKENQGLLRIVDFPGQPGLGSGCPFTLNT